MLFLFFTVLSVKTTAFAEDNTISTSNLLLNAGPTTTTTDGWVDTDNKWQCGNFTADGYTGNIFLPIKTRSYALKSASLYQDVDIRGYATGTEMTLSADMRSYEQSSYDLGILTLQYLNENEEVISYESQTYANPKWSTKTITTTKPENAVTARIILGGKLKCGNVLNVYYKNMIFYSESDYIFDLEPKTQTIPLNTTVTANLFIDNITNIAAEDVYLTYDTEKLEFLGFEEVSGVKLVYCDENSGVLRFILASQGENNIANDKKTLLNLKFKGISVGETVVDVTRGRVSDGITMEENVDEKLCGDCTIIIEDDGSVDDVNHTGEFTLLDLAIDARNFGKDPASEALTQYNTDIVINNAIDNDDLLKIGQYMVQNPNYPFNK